ncbi:ribosomal protein L7/L12 [Nonomuraea sp. NPDC049714]|uniref:ribosomal protein L7/L12 n=1 Tax=Nonomuraea sp. NPDC049714 TaxID=3364357 RepID=UPI0037BE11C3
MPMGISVMELLAIGIFLVGAIAITMSVVINRRRAGITKAPPYAPEELDGALRELIRRDRKIQAIKLLREHTGMGLKQAKDAIDGLAAGRPLHPPVTQQHAPPQEDLATRVRRLKESGRTEQAVFLVRGETGMDEAGATLFVDSL